MEEIGVQSGLAELLFTLPKEEMRKLMDPKISKQSHTFLTETIFNTRKADQPEGVFIDNIQMKGKLST